MIYLFIILTLPIPSDYKLQVGDEIMITVKGNINFSYRQVISPEGTIFIQYGDTLLLSYGYGTVLEIAKISGQTLNEAKEVLQSYFNKYFKNIDVNITVIKFSDYIYVEGAIVKPGAYPYFAGKIVREYIGLAGGALPEGDIENVKITLPDGRVINGDLEYAPERNSIIVVPYAYVYVRGEVKNPGSFPYYPGANVLHYIGMAGGLTSRSDLGRSYIIKTKEKKKLPINEVKAIDKGDIIVVQEVILKWWQDYLTIASTFTTLLIAWLTIRR